MNTCILMADVIQDPQLRYTQDNQLAIAEFTVQFDGLRDDDPPGTLRVVGFGNLAQEIQDNYHQGDRLIIEGRLGINSVDRPEGFKEKRVELTAQRIYRLDAGAIATVSTATVPVATPASMPRPASPPKTPEPAPARTPAPTYPTPAPKVDPPDYDDIPF